MSASQFASARADRALGLADPSSAPARPTEAEVDPMFVDRWSPRAFAPTPVPEPILRSVFEAARWAPSSANEQPWRFVYARTAEDRERFAGGLMEMNRGWARSAPVLAFLLARKRVRAGPYAGQPNPTAWFDAGAAWMSLALQAHLRGLATHAMGGIDRDRVLALLGASPEEYDAVIAIALGYRGEASTLPAPLAERERPSPRLPFREVVSEGTVRLDDPSAGVAGD